MNNEEIIKRIYGNIYYMAERFIDEWGRIRESRFIEFCSSVGEGVDKMFRQLRMSRITEDGIVYLQPLALDGIGPELIPEITTEDQIFLDRIAEKIVVEYFNTHPEGFKDNLKIARLAYSQALAMLEVKNNGLQELINKNGLNYKV